MKSFIGEEFLLSTKTAKDLYKKYAKGMPIIDFHCHISPKEIALDMNFKNMTEIWLNTDHYKWRLMRANGVEEHYITGQASDWEKFQKWAETLSKAIGNPVYHWSHMELQRYFDVHGQLNEETAKEVWDICNEKLQKPEMSPRNLIRSSNVSLLCTTDDPVDSLEWHEKIAKSESFQTRVLPTWRPDLAMNLEQSDYICYLGELERVSDSKINCFVDLKDALIKRMDVFQKYGCSVSDHGLETVMYLPVPPEKVETIFKKRIEGEVITKEEELAFKTALMQFLGREYHKRNWVMQLHYGCKRNINRFMFERVGADTGFDSINNVASSGQLAEFLNSLNLTNELPKTIIYSLNPNDNATIGTIIGCFQEGPTVGKIQQGSAWWFNDHKEGMVSQMVSMANLGLLSNFVGMVTDSRSLLSYTRHDYFRRILCDLIGGWVENGEYPRDEKRLEEIIKGISYENARKYFDFDEV